MIRYLTVKTINHIDCDGDGVITFADTAAISQNYGMVHNKTSGICDNGTDPPLYLEILQDTVTEGDTMIITVNLGTPAIPAI